MPDLYFNTKTGRGFTLGSQAPALDEYGIKMSTASGLGYAGSPAGGGAQVWRTFNQGMRVPVLGYDGAASRSRTNLTRHYSKVGFRKFRIGIAVWEFAGSPLAERLMQGSQVIVRFQVAIEPIYVASLTGLGARIPITFGGNNYVEYNFATWDVNQGMIWSDVITLPSEIAADAFFRFATTVELPAGTWSNNLPYQRSASSFLNRFEGVLISSNSQIVAFGGASDVALAATTFSAVSAIQLGASGFFAPSCMEIEVAPSKTFVSLFGSSTPFGSIEGGAGSGSEGDVRGSALGNAGPLERYFYEELGVNLLNISRASWSLAHMITAGDAGWQYTKQLLARNPPAVIINANMTNDTDGESGTPASWAVSTLYTKFKVIQVVGQGLYMAGNAGTTSASTATRPTGTTPIQVLDGITWYYMGPIPSVSLSRAYATILTNMSTIHEKIVAAAPGVPIYAYLIRPGSDSPGDSWATVAGQTAKSGYGDATSKRGYLNAALKAPLAPYNVNGYINPNPAVEYNYPTETSLWAVADDVTATTGTANFMTVDGSHANSHGAVRQSKNMITLPAIPAP